MIGTECPECATDLARVTLFESLPPKDLLQLATVVRREHFPRDATLFLQGQRADRFYVLVEGAVKLFRTSPDGRQQILHTVMPPNAFAEAAVFAGGRYPAHAVAMKPSECLLLPRCEFVHLLGRHPAGRRRARHGRVPRRPLGAAPPPPGLTVTAGSGGSGR